MYFKLVGIQWAFVGIAEYKFVLHEIWEEKCFKQAEPFLMWLIRWLLLLFFVYAIEKYNVLSGIYKRQVKQVN